MSVYPPSLPPVSLFPYFRPRLTTSEQLPAACHVGCLIDFEIKRESARESKRDIVRERESDREIKREEESVSVYVIRDKGAHTRAHVPGHLYLSLLYTYTMHGTYICAVVCMLVDGCVHV